MNRQGQSCIRHGKKLRNCAPCATAITSLVPFKSFNLFLRFLQSTSLNNGVEWKMIIGIVNTKGERLRAWELKGLGLGGLGLRPIPMIANSRHADDCYRPMSWSGPPRGFGDKFL